MLYLMNKKFFKKKIEKMASRNDYFVIDGENYGVGGNTTASDALSAKYSNVHTCGGLCPEARLMGYLKKMKAGEHVDETKFDKEVKEYLHDASFTMSIGICMKAIIAKGPGNPTNIFVVFPNVVYKYLSNKILKRFIKVADLDFDFIKTQADIKEDIHCLDHLLNNNQMMAIDKTVLAIGRKFEDND